MELGVGSWRNVAISLIDCGSMSVNACLRQLSWWSSVTRSRTGPAPIKARTTLRGPPVASSEMAWPEIAACVLFLGHVAIGEGLQVGDDGELLPVVQSKISYLGCVDVDSHFWGWPSRAGNVPCVVEMNDLLQRLEVTIVRVGFNEMLRWPQVDVAQGWNFVLAPFSHVNRLRITRSLEEASQAGVNPVITVRVPLRLIVERIQRVPGDAQVIVGEVGEVRRHKRSCAPSCVTVGALRLAVEQRKALLLLDGEPGLSFQPIVVLGGELGDFLRSLVRSDRPADALVIRVGVGADLKEQILVVRIQHFINHDLRAGVVLLQGVQEGTLGLFSQRVAEDQAGGPAVPEHATHPFRPIKMQDRAIASIGGRGRLAVAETARHGTFIDRPRSIDGRVRPSIAYLPAVAGCAGLPGRGRQVRIE